MENILSYLQIIFKKFSPFIYILAGICIGLIAAKILKITKKNKKKKEAYNLQKKEILRPLIPEMTSLPISCKELCDDGKTDKHQQQALTSPYKHTLVIAGAGSGKTTILTKRVILLNKYIGIPIHQVLVLAFNRSAAEEVATRVAKQLNIPLDDNILNKNIRTIHSLAYEVFKTKMPYVKIFKSEKELRNIVKQILNEEKEGNGRYDYITKVIDLFGDGNNKAIKFLNKKSNDSSCDIECSDGTMVRSQAEKNIIENLLKNKIKFEYEPLVTWADMYFQPDFYFPDYDIYAEYWGMIEHYDPILREQYIKHMQWKKNQFKKYKIYLINLMPPSKEHPQKPEEYLVNHLKNKCDVKKTSGPNIKKMEKIFNIFEEELIDLILSVINMTLAYSKKIEELIPKAKPFIKEVINFIIPFCEKFEKRIEMKGKTTFTHVMKGAVDIFKNNPKLLNEYYDSYKFIFVDEVQDLQPLTREFISFLAGDKQALFAIGDDYQSIYSFAGSDPAFIVKFEYYFPDVKKIKLLYNYRCHPRIVDISNAIIKNNSVQDFKEVIGKYNDGQSPEDKVVTVIRLDNEIEQRQSLIEYVLAQIPEGESLKILSRYNPENETIKPYVELLKDEKGEINYHFQTIHKSKGLEADNVLILGCINHVTEKYCFPACDIAQSIKDNILSLCRGPEFNLSEEENRLFYVAITRAKKRVFIATVKGKESKFVSEKYLPRNLINLVDLALVAH